MMRFRVDSFEVDYWDIASVGSTRIESVESFGWLNEDFGNGGNARIYCNYLKQNQLPVSSIYELSRVLLSFEFPRLIVEIYEWIPNW
ncbi:hypothetical protein V6N13_126004 [Hibiscus sabdariffa]|uniref:Uncharacterized protein n=1 Tax=Hibiscus sabdariffa TaxID=183260 RepID=A0ABR2NWR2_9ROSI